MRSSTLCQWCIAVAMYNFNDDIYIYILSNAKQNLHWKGLSAKHASSGIFLNHEVISVYHLKCLQIPFCVFIILIEITLITLRRKYDKSTLVKIIACSMTATNLYPSQCWPRSVSLNDATRPHRVKEHQIKPDKICFVQVHKSTAVTLPCSVQHVGNIIFLLKLMCSDPRNSTTSWFILRGMNLKTYIHVLEQNMGAVTSSSYIFSRCGQIATDDIRWVVIMKRFRVQVCTVCVYKHPMRG